MSGEQLRPGYKRTEVGVIPEEWEVKRIGDLFNVAASGDLDALRTSDIQDTDFQYPIYSNSLENLGLYGYASYNTYFQDSITVTARGTLGIANYRDHPYVAIGRVLVLQPKTKLEGRFFSYYISTRISFAVESTGVPQLTAPQISKYVVPLPPLPEQRAIAEALADVDALLAAQDRLIAKKRAIKQAAMQDLLTGRVRLPGFMRKPGYKKTEIGEIPEDWELKKMDEVATVDPDSLGANTVPDYEFRYISIENVEKGSLLGHSEQIFRTAPSRARKRIKKGDVLFCTVRPNLQSHLLFSDESDDWVCSTGFCILRSQKDFSSPEFVFFQVFAPVITKQVEALIAGSNYPAISSRDVRTLIIPFPSLPEQRAIAEVLSDMDAEIAALERRRAKTQALKQGMMQELLTGRIRLV